MAKYAFIFDEAETIDVDVEASGMQTTVVPVMFRKDGVRVANEGTAFCVAVLDNGEAIFATAKHVVEQLDGADGIEPFILLPRGLDDPAARKDLQGVPVHLVSLADNFSDVALIVADIKKSLLPVASELRGLDFTLDPPVVGEFCMALGYPQRAGVISYSMVASRGLIEAVHPKQRDTVLSTFPSFQTTGLYHSGMSGGPIIDRKGHVVGVVSHGFEADESGRATGFGASIAGLAELKLDLHNNDGDIQEFTVKELIEDMGVLRAAGTGVTLEREDDGVTLRWHLLASEAPSGESR